ncbi:RNA-binding protein 12 [Drosophila elegans]|uniref:RNA-binding protein 12 n=1 Tax=Drosophila elegans TaxID=30023 RepID=UPI0007E7B36C|nr:RNA-binding protein 12 [Drosophila elegans]
MLRIRSVDHVLLLVLVAIVLVTAKQETAARQFGGQNFGNGLGPAFGGGSGFGPGIGPGLGPGSVPGASGYPGQGLGPGPGYGPPQQQPGCPLCDSSVYTYCSHKMVHDACCCDFPASVGPQLRPPQCLYYDCSLLYAKSCYEHALIKNCCCNNPY